MQGVPEIPDRPVEMGDDGGNGGEGIAELGHAFVDPGEGGGGGIGDFAIRYGYYRYETPVMFIAVVLMVLLVTAVQLGGNRLARVTDKRI